MGWIKRVRAGLAAAEKASELAQELRTAQTRVLDLCEHVAGLEDRIVAQQSEFDQIRIDWATTLDKIGRWASRQSARERKDTQKKLDVLADGEPVNGAPVPVKDLTKPQLRALAARMRMGGAGVTSHEGQ